MMLNRPIGIVVGLAAEARIARRLGGPAEVSVEIGGGGEAGAEAAAARLVAAGAGALVSFGLAGGLDPALAPGTLLRPVQVLWDGGAARTDAALTRALGGDDGAGALFGGGGVVATVAAKRALYAATGAAAVDLESAAVARAALRHHLPFAALRAVCDPAGRALPRAALVALDAHGRIGGLRVAGAVLSRLWEVPALLALAADAARARRALLARVLAIAPLRITP